VVDVEGDAAIVSAYAKPLLLEILAERGGAINDLYSWTAKAEGREISLSGKLSKTGMRRLMSIVNSPASEVPTADSQASQISPGELPAIQAKASLKHFRAVTQMAEELKEDMRDAKNLASTSLWFDKYAKRIERLPTLNVDPQLLNYSAFVANHLRQASLAVKTMGIQSGVREGQVTSGSVNPYGAYPYPGTRWGGYGYYGGYSGCGYYYRKWMRTGSRYWRNRYYDCRHW